MHLFVRFCEANCKQTRAKSRVFTKPADLMRISSHLFFRPKTAPHARRLSTHLRLAYTDAQISPIHYP